jgi:Skp family chaperone for outer membrane proteins
VKLDWLGRLKCIAAGAVCVAALANPVMAQKVPAPVIAVVDTQLILRDATAAKNIRSQVDKLREKFRKEIGEEEESLRVADRELAQQRQLLSSEAFSKRRQELQSQIATLQRKAQDRKRQLEKAVRGAMRAFQENMLKVTAELARERGANLVLPKSQVLLVDGTLELTSEALKRLNARLTKVKVELPKE